MLFAVVCWLSFKNRANRAMGISGDAWCLARLCSGNKESALYHNDCHLHSAPLTGFFVGLCQTNGLISCTVTRVTGWIKIPKKMMNAARGCWYWAAGLLVSGKSHETVLSQGDSQTTVLSNRGELFPFLMKGQPCSAIKHAGSPHLWEWIIFKFSFHVSHRLLPFTAPEFMETKCRLNLK